MKTLPLVDRNLFSYNFIPDLPLSLKKEISIYENTEASVEFAKAHVFRAKRLASIGAGGPYRKFLPRLNSAFSLLSSLMV